MLVDTHGQGMPLPQNDFSEASEIWLRQLRNLSTFEAREELLKFVGVGRKVADCILLMSLDKKEVVPVDTHVHQIALKHYGFKSLSRGKATMTPKLYEDLNLKFFSIWGDYAGWAHSVLFTADLKSFSSYGLEPPSSVLPPSNSSTPKERAEKHLQPLKSVLEKPSVTPSASPLKRKWDSELGVHVEISPVNIAEHRLEDADDRVKKRR
jgi:N-glycosylase/DNA lyase